MKRICIILLAAALLLQGCAYNKSENKSIHIAVMLEDEEESFVHGINSALSDVLTEYPDYDISCTFYTDFGNYDTGAGIIDKISSDSTVTAVLTSRNLDISKTAAHEFEKNGKLMIGRYSLYDEVLADNNYKLAVSLCYSAKDMGNIARNVAGLTGLKNWTVCYADDEFSRQEVRNFVSNTNDGIQISDCMKEDSLIQRFDSTMSKWQSLGIQGVAIFPYDSSALDLVKKLKEVNPELCIIGDFELDNAKYMMAIPDWEATFENLNLLEQFHINNTEEKDLDKLIEMSDEGYIDTFTIHGYNSLRMIVDTAVKNNTVNPSLIAEHLRNEGYKGLTQTFKFNGNGMLAYEEYSFSTLKNGEWEASRIDVY